MDKQASRTKKDPALTFAASRPVTPEPTFKLKDVEISNLSKLLHVLEAADFLSVSKRTLQQLTADRLVAVVKFGRNVRYDIADLRRFAESRKIREIGWKAVSKSIANTGGIQ